MPIGTNRIIGIRCDPNIGNLRHFALRCDLVGELDAAAACLRRAEVSFARGEAGRCRRALDDGLALAAGSGTPVEAGLLLKSAQLLAWEFDPARSLAAAQHAATVARRAGAYLPEAELIVGQAFYVAEDERCIPRFRAARQLAAKAGRLDTYFEAWFGEAAALEMFGRMRESLALAEAIEREARARGKLIWTHQAEWTIAHARWLSTGEVEPAIASLRRLAGLRTMSLHRSHVLAELALVLADGGEVDEARRVIARAEAEADTTWSRGVAAFYRGELEWSAGRAGRALATVDAALAAGLFEPLTTLSRIARLWALWELDRPAADPALSHRLVPLLAGAAAENEAFAALGDGRTEAAEGQLLAAAAAWRGRMARNELRARWAAGELARRRGDAATARARLVEAERDAARLGCVSVLARIRASLRRLAGSERSRRSSEAGQPSPRELEVLRLVARGQTSKAIAAALGISRKTVETHVAAATAKLGARTRLQAAAAAGFLPTPAAAPVRLAPDELVLLGVLADGGTVTDAALRVGISRRTATRRLASARARLGVATNAEAVLAAAGVAQIADAAAGHAS